ncbi:MAG: thioredoxin family protein [Bacteroidetes bacterium]|nr:thioredoxin family protein [Bacteroidota bacterium]
MKTYYTTFILFLLLTSTVFSQKVNKVEYSERVGSMILIGECNRDAFTMEPFQEWYDFEYEEYTPEQTVIEKLKKHINDVLRIKIVMGSWCSDSQREVPRFYRIMDEAGIPDEKVELLSVNRDKVVPGMDISALKIERVPTFIIHDGLKELGRIIETPAETLEKDFLRILVNKPLHEPE